MTEKDRELTEKMIKEAVSNQNELIGLHLKNILDKLEVIDKKVSITNSKVAEQEKKIFEYGKEIGSHYTACPNSGEIKDIKKQIATIEKMEVGREAVSKFTWKQLTGIGIVAGIVFGALKFALDLLNIVIK